MGKATAKRAVAIASVSPDAAQAGARAADEGGNAVDAAIAAALVATVTHPGMCSLGGGGFLAILPTSGSAVVVDGGHEMPGRGLPPDRFGAGGVEVHLEYGGGVQTRVGPGSVATPGGLAACALAAERYGHLPWRRLVEPAWERARAGFPMSFPSHAYLRYAHRPIYSRDPRSRAALHDATGRLLDPGETIRVKGLAESLRAIAEEGAEAFYRGDLGRKIADHVQEEGGILTRRDLATYRAVVRRPLRASLEGWRLSTNPPPAVGGAILAAMLRLTGGRSRREGHVRRLVAAQRAVLDYRRERLDASRDLDTEVHRLLQAAAGGSPEGVRRAAGATSTLHTSTVDSTGMACAITLSDGYGSGIMPPGTGIWLNNCLGERELNRRGFHALPPGTRLASNMAPTVGREGGGAALAIGSPGADRITTAILQVLLNFVRLRMPLERAVAAPRLHVERGPAGARVACEPGVPVDGPDSTELPVRPFPELSMFFGGVAAAVWKPGKGFELAADPRRAGGTAEGGRG